MKQMMGYFKRKKWTRGSKAVLTVETAMVLPIFLFAVLMFCYLFQVMEFQLKLQAALNQTAEQTASYGYLLGRVTAVTEQKAKEILEETALFSERGLLSVDAAGEWVMKLLRSASADVALKEITARHMEIEDSRMLRVVGGWEGVSFHGSLLRDEEHCVIVKAEYAIRMPFLPELFSEMKAEQTAVCRLFCGDREYVPAVKEGREEEDEEIFFVTPNGMVYHTRRDCRYLKFTVLSTDTAALETKRNNSGGKYYPCSLCAKGTVSEGFVYYTSGGSSYHTTKYCSSLTRTVMERTKEEIEKMPPCSYCGQGK